MKNKSLIIIAFILFIIFIFLLNTPAPIAARVVVKSLIMPVLIVFVLINTDKHTSFSLLVITALALSTLGDLFMELQTQNEKFFLPGLGSFLLAHIAYISAFSYRLKIKIFTGKNIIIALVLVLALVCLLIYLWPTLGDMKIPVVLYALIISLATFTAYLRACEDRHQCLLFWGALLFLLSDALLAIYLFKTHFTFGREINMTFYVTGQALIAIGATEINPTKNVLQSSHYSTDKK